MKSRIVKLPGLVDVHVHFRQPGATHKEDFSSGTKAAIAGGYTQVLDMPNNIPPTTTFRAVNEKMKLAKNKIWCDVGFNFGATFQSTKYFKNISKKVFGLKVYMGKTTGPLLITDLQERELIFKSWMSPLPIMVHVNGEEVEEAISLAKKYKKRLHICHTTSDQIRLIRKAKKEGIEVTCEVTPHHLFLDTNDLKKLGALALMKPPLESSKNRQALWGSLEIIDIIATDHAPHTLNEKHEASPPFGVPGLETTIPLFAQAISKKLITLKRFEQMACKNPRKIFLLPDQRKTYITVEVGKSFPITSMKLFTKCNWTPFKNLEGAAVVREVVIRNKVVFKNGEFVGVPSGKIIYPNTRNLS